MKHIIVGIVFASLASAVFAAGTNELSVIPLPQKMARLDGEFRLAPDTRIFAEQVSVETAEFLAQRLRPATGYRFKVGKPGAATAGGILLTTNGADAALGAEGYELTVATNGIVIRAPAPAGLFYGVQTLLQLLPPEIFSTNAVKPFAWTAPCVTITDQPRFAWRGLMLDVSRHFYTKAEVERILDEMALFKLNTFHWHLVDDQGWRIEIKKYPKLTQTGAWRTQSVLTPPNKKASELDQGNARPEWAKAAATAFGRDGRYGGFYTQRDIREVVAHAAARHITVVPEIEMPGHAIAALAAYPQFSCNGGPYSTDSKAGVNSGVFDPSNGATLRFLDDVLAEVAGLFPGKIIHIGGDEVSPKAQAETWGKSPPCQALMKREGLKNEMELQDWFLRQIEKMVLAHGKRLIGWTETGGSGLTTNAVVMDWKGGGLEAARTGRDAVMVPTKFCYLDYYQSTNHAAEPHAIGGFVPLEKTYSFEPVPANLAPEFQSHILGGQCNLWTEYVASLAHVEYMLFPRACALAEVTWSAREARDFGNFLLRLGIISQRLDQMGVNYHPLPAGASEPAVLK